MIIFDFRNIIFHLRGKLMIYNFQLMVETWKHPFQHIPKIFATNCGNFRTSYDFHISNQITFSFIYFSFIYIVLTQQSEPHLFITYSPRYCAYAASLILNC